MWISILLLLAGSALYLIVKRHYSYWERKGFPYDKPSIPFGTLDSVRRRQLSIGMAIYDVYAKSKEKFIGIYLVFRPALLIRDAELVRNILMQDFASFHDRGIYVDAQNDPLSGNLFALPGQQWKSMRGKLAPSFTSGKLKGMFGTIEDVANKMIAHLDTIIPADGTQTIEIKSLLSTYAIDIIGSVIFGLDINSFEDPKNKFRTISAKVNEPTIKNVMRTAANMLCPPLEKFFVRIGMKDEVLQFMKLVVQQTIEYREKNNISRKDMMQLLIQLRNTGKINTDDSIWDAETSADSLKEMSIEKITAQAYIFYIAGHETTASTTAFTLYELSQYPDLLAKAQKDVEDTLAKHGKLTYEAIQDMKFIDLCIMETIRKYPALPFLNRECTQDFQIPGTDLIIEKGTPIVISLLGMHRDPEHFPDPLKYDPERFLETNKNYNPVAYMPFGEGPRHCIALRMGRVNVKVALAKLLTAYNVETKEKQEIEIDNYGVVIMPKGGINVQLSKKKNNKKQEIVV